MVKPVNKKGTVNQKLPRSCLLEHVDTCNVTHMAAHWVDISRNIQVNRNYNIASRYKPVGEQKWDTAMWLQGFV